LIEVLPAILLFGAISLLGLRLLRVSLVMQERSLLSSQRHSAFEAVWEKWEVTGGRFACAVEGEGSGWTVFDFPDQSWIPEAGLTGYQWRRKRLTDAEGNTRWLIETRGPGAGNWSEWMGILDRP
jgi:hypothetical protein